MNFAIWASASARSKGVYLLLANGQKLEWPDEEVTIDYSTRFFANSSVLLSPDQIELLIKVPITDIRLDHFDKALSRKEGERFSEYLTCLLTTSDEEVKEQKVL